MEKVSKGDRVVITDLAHQARKRESKPAFRPAAAVKSRLRAVARYDDATTQQLLSKIPADRRAAFLWERVAPREHAPSRPLYAALAQTAASVPLHTLVEALE